jgi:hypothetical protein
MKGMSKDNYFFGARALTSEAFAAQPHLPALHLVKALSLRQAIDGWFSIFGLTRNRRPC